MVSGPDALNMNYYSDMENETAEVTRSNDKTCISDEKSTYSRAHIKNVDSKPEVKLNVTEVTQAREMNEVTKRMGQELSCILCLELYNNPLLLPCLHSFCKACLERLIQLKRSSRCILRCPLCRIGTDLKGGGVNALQKNFQLSGLVDIFKQLRKDTTVEESHPPSVIPKISEPQENQASDHPILQPPSNVLNGYLFQDDSYYTDSESGGEESESEIVTWNEEFQNINPYVNISRGDSTIETVIANDHIGDGVWYPSDCSEPPSESESPDSVIPPLPSRSRRRSVLLPRSLIRSINPYVESRGDSTSETVIANVWYPSDSEVETWSGEVQTMNQDISRGHSTSETVIANDHSRECVWYPSNYGELPSESESPESVKLPLPPRPKNRHPKNGIRSRIVNFFKRNHNDI